MMKIHDNDAFDCIVIGAGHAGLEAALVAARMNARTLLLNLSFSTIGEMSCNPAIGGVGKGQLVKEIDALGGEMGKAADYSAIQFRQLNASKGPAVRSSRCQSDRALYRAHMQKKVVEQKQLIFEEGKVGDILVKGSAVCGVRMEDGRKRFSSTVILTPGTFLDGKIHLGPKIFPAGRIDESSSTQLADNLRDLGFALMHFKTGTPPRLDGQTIDFSLLARQDSDVHPLPFSFSTGAIPLERTFLPCYLTETNAHTHQIIKENMHLSPMYSGQIQSTGVRYCPSIEDKLVKFADKQRHQVFLEPEGLDTHLYYPNGISTGLPEDVQDRMVHSIKGLEHVRIVRYGYSIEHAVINATELTSWLESKKIKGLFCAGQINGTTGYEEAAAQGMIAGINAALRIQGNQPFILGREEAYMGVLIDDLVTKGTPEPYRMFTSRVEHRLIIREDNADKRMAGYAYQFGLISRQSYDQVMKKYALIDEEIETMKITRIWPGTAADRMLEHHQSSPLRGVVNVSDLLKRPEITYAMIKAWNVYVRELPTSVTDQIEYEIKFEGFIQRQKKELDRFRYLENIKMPVDMDYTKVPGLSIEIQQKLQQCAPLTLGQAHRVSGVTPAAISILMVYLKKRKAFEKFS